MYTTMEGSCSIAKGNLDFESRFTVEYRKHREETYSRRPLKMQVETELEDASRLMLA